MQASLLLNPEHSGFQNFISEGENAITMLQNAIDNCVEKNRLDLEDYEMIVVCTDTPEFLSPTNAMKVVGLYGDKMKNVKGE